MISRILSGTVLKFAKPATPLLSCSTGPFGTFKRCGVLPYGVNHFLLYPFWTNVVACWSDLNVDISKENVSPGGADRNRFMQKKESKFLDISHFAVLLEFK